MKILSDDNKVLFDPGFAPYVLVFSTSYSYMDAQVRSVKNANQRRMKYRSFETPLMKLCENLISFYFGGMLYGAFLKYKFKNSPAEFENNEFLGLNKSDCEKGDVSIEVFSLEKFIKSNDRNPFASKKVKPEFTAIIDDYIEFLNINNYFTDVKTTNDIKLPVRIENIVKNDIKNPDEILKVIENAIENKKIEILLNSVYFEKLKL